MIPLISNRLKWIMPGEKNQNAIQNLTSQIKNLHPIVAGILMRRGMNSYEDVKDFFKIDLDEIHNFGELKDCEKAANRVVKAIENKEKILVYGDFDVDGTTAVSMFMMFLKSVGARVDFYIPDKNKEGYGVSERGVEFTLSGNYNLMITLDCGIKAVHKLNEISNGGTDVIICDHHLPGNELPNVFAILNPLQKDCNFRGKELCGCGVGLMLLIALSRKLNLPDEWKKYLDLAAVATCCDIVSLTGINRIIVHAGIAQINENRRTSLDALLKVAGYDQLVDVADVVFKIGPRINAAGRLAHARLIVSLLVETDFETAVEHARQIEALNVKRKSLDQSITASALEQMHAYDPKLERSATVVYSDEWHKGVIGIVASRLIEECHRPTVVFTQTEDMLVGSGRSVEGVHLYRALQECSTHLVTFGGHASAAGLSLKIESLTGFMQDFETAVSKQSPQKWTIPELNIDAVVSFYEWYNKDFNKFLAQLNRCRPYGPNNLEPVFATLNCKAKNLRVVGKDHLKFEVYQEEYPQMVIPVIAFRMADAYEDLRSQNGFSLAYTVGENVWNDKRNIQLTAKDLVMQ